MQKLMYEISGVNKNYFFNAIDSNKLDDINIELENFI